MMKLLKYSIVFMILSTILSLESCTHKVLVTEDDGYQYYKVTKKDKIGVKDLEGNVIVPIKMKEIEYHSRNNKQKNKDRWFWCSCYDNDYNEVYNADNYDCIIGEDLKFAMISPYYLDDYRERTSTFFKVRHKSEGNAGLYDFMGKEVVPLKYESIRFVHYRHKKRDNNSEKYADPSDLFRCEDYRGYCSVFDASGKCIIPDDYGYKDVCKVGVPTPSPLLCCYKGKRGRMKCDYRYSSSGELFLSGDITVNVIKRELYYLEVKDDDGKNKSYYDVYGDIIASGKDLRLRYDNEEGFYWKDDDYENRYINKKISENGHVVPVHNYSNSSSWGWSGYGNQDVWTGSGYNSEYEWMDLSSSNDGGYGTTDQQRQSRACGLCGGSGREIRTDGISFGNTKYCSECGKTVPDNHYHAPCRSCGGKGWR